jgi:hypothetical protein
MKPRKLSSAKAPPKKNPSAPKTRTRAPKGKAQPKPTRQKKQASESSDEEVSSSSDDEPAQRKPRKRAKHAVQEVTDGEPAEVDVEIVNSDSEEDDMQQEPANNEVRVSLISLIITFSHVK